MTTASYLEGRLQDHRGERNAMHSGFWLMERKLIDRLNFVNIFLAVFLRSGTVF